MEQLYQAILIDHYRNPRNAQLLGNNPLTVHLHNPLCGDSVSVQIECEADHIVRIAVQSTGCVVSVASGSLLSQHVLKSHISTVCDFDKNTVLHLIGIPLGPTRLKCAMLALDALQECVHKYRNR